MLGGGGGRGREGERTVCSASASPFLGLAPPAVLLPLPPLPLLLQGSDSSLTATGGVVRFKSIKLLYGRSGQLSRLTIRLSLGHDGAWRMLRQESQRDLIVKQNVVAEQEPSSRTGT
jgi:hypothetical protein